MRGWFLALGALLVLGFWVSAENLPPVAEPVFLLTRASTAVEFDLSEYVADPEEEELSFRILSPPEKGALVAIPPAYVYIPDPGFVGTDLVVILVEDPWGGFDLATVEVAVLEEKLFLSPPTLRTRQKLVLSSPPPELSFAYSSVGMTQQIGGFVLEFDAGFSEISFNSFRATMRGTWDGPLGKIRIRSSLALDPSVPAADSWRTEFRFSLWNFTLRFTPYFDFSYPDRSYNRLRFEGKLGEPPVKAKGEIDFHQWPLEFDELWVELEGGGLFCQGLEWKARLEGDKDGFQEFSVKLSGIGLGCCEPLDPQLAVDITFTPVEKEVTVIPELSPVWFLCVRPLMELQLPEVGVGIAGAEVFGYDLRCDLPNDMSLRLATSLNPQKNARVTGHSEYFEVVSLSGTILPCCGGPGRWMISVYFGEGSGELFSWGRTVITWVSPVNDEITISTRLTLEPGEYELEFTWRGVF